MLTFFLPYVVTMLFYIIILSCCQPAAQQRCQGKGEPRDGDPDGLRHPTPAAHREDRWVGHDRFAANHRLGGHREDLVSQEWDNFQPADSAFQLPPSFLVWGLIFFLLGYAVYASLMAGLGGIGSQPA